MGTVKGKNEILKTGTLLSLFVVTVLKWDAFVHKKLNTGVTFETQQIIVNSSIYLLWEKDFTVSSMLLI